MSLGFRIKERREQLGLSRAELAEMVGVQPTSIANYETSFSKPKPEFLYKFFSALKCDANYLFQDEMAECEEYVTTGINEDERALLRGYRKLNAENKNKILKLTSSLLDVQEADSILERVDEAKEGTGTA